MRPAYQSATYGTDDASRAVDDPSVYTLSETGLGTNPWWLVELPYETVVSHMEFMDDRYQCHQLPYFLVESITK